MIIELKPTPLIAIEVPLKSFDFRLLRDDNLTYISYLPNDNTKSREGFDFRFLSTPDKYKILGEVTKDKIGFDVEPYLDKNTRFLFRNYKDNRFMSNRDLDTFDWQQYPNSSFSNKEESFISLLQANGLYFVNPMIRKLGFDVINEEQLLRLGEDYDEWESYEEKLVTKLLIIEKL